MGVRFLRSSISLSLGVHALFIFACALLLSQQATLNPARKLTWVELTPKNISDIRKETDQLRKQIVQTAPGREVEKAADDAFMGERNQVVDRQTVSKEKQIAIAAQNAASKAISAAKSLTESKLRAAPLATFGIPVIPHLRDLAEKSQARPDSPQWATPGQEAKDYIRGMKEGEKTALNTREYVFYGYYQRIRERLDRAWIPILRERLVTYYRTGRQLASDMDHTTRLMVVLNGSGEIVRVQVLSASGNHDLDEAAVRAFNRAGPFPNPPKGIVDPRGQIQIPWEFILRT